MRDCFIYYLESNVVCFIVFGILLIHDVLGVDRQEKQIKYDHALIAFMSYFVSDVLWAAIVSGVLPKSAVAVIAVNFSNFVLMAAITYTWLEYVMAVEQVPHRDRKINKFAVVFPFLVSAVALILTFVISPRTLMDENYNMTLTFSIFMIAVPIINIVAVLIYALRKARVEENPIERKNHLQVGFFPLLVIGGGLLQITFLPNAPIFCFCCAILMLVFYIQSMERQISMDPLTKLSNRAQLMRYASSSPFLHKDERKAFVVMIDVNDFKMINDTFGHSEGDRALVIIADSLKKSVNLVGIPTFLGRYGGDEFIIIVHTASAKEVNALIKDVREQIAFECSERKTPYVLSIGVGYDQLNGEHDSVQKCMQRADENLYIDKKNCKSRGETTFARKN